MGVTKAWDSFTRLNMYTWSCGRVRVELCRVGVTLHVGHRLAHLWFDWPLNPAREWFRRKEYVDVAGRRLRARGGLTCPVSFWRLAFPPRNPGCQRWVAFGPLELSV